MTTIMTAASGNMSDSTASFHNGGGLLVVLVFVAVPICVGLYFIYSKKQSDKARAATLEESPEQRRERLNAVRQRRLEKLQERSNDENDQKESKSKSSSKIGEQTTTRGGLRRRKQARSKTESHRGKSTPQNKTESENSIKDNTQGINEILMSDPIKAEKSAWDQENGASQTKSCARETDMSRPNADSSDVVQDNAAKPYFIDIQRGQNTQSDNAIQQETVDNVETRSCDATAVSSTTRSGQAAPSDTTADSSDKEESTSSREIVDVSMEEAVKQEAHVAESTQLVASPFAESTQLVASPAPAASNIETVSATNESSFAPATKVDQVPKENVQDQKEAEAQQGQHTPETTPAPRPSTLESKMSPAKTASESRENTSDFSTDQKKTKKRKRSLLPPPQILCEALSHVFKRKVEVQQVVGGGTWGGEQWKKRSCEYSYFNAIVLPLNTLKPETMKNEWKALTSAFSKLVNLQSVQEQLFSLNNIKEAAQCHARAKNLSRNGFALLMEKDEGFQEITSCINTLSLWLAAQVAKAIRPHVDAVKQDLEVGDDDDDIGGLFADEYCGEPMAVSDSNGTSPLETLFVLLQDAAAPTITAGFLEDLFIQYNGVAAGENDNDHQLACIFLAYALKRIAQAKQSGGLVSAANLSNHVATLSNLVLAPSVCQALASAMASEVAEMANKNGHEIQGISCLSPLLVTAAYCVPIAGDEQRQPNSSNGAMFRQQLSQIQDFPIATFRAKDNDEVGRVMRDARRTMHTTRSTAVALLRIAFKTGGKEQTFKWLTEIIRSNEQLLHLLKSDLLKSDGIVARSSSRDFLLGLVWSLSDFCQASLLSCLDKKGSKAFDTAFLTEALSETSHEPVNEKNRLFQGSKPSDDGCSTSGESSFDGATHFFFLLSLLLHVGLHPTLRMEYEFEYHYNKFVHAIQERALDDKAPRCSEAVLAKYSPIVATWLGWRTFFDDPELSACLTDVALLQLGWLATVASENCESLNAIPDWLCREPAHWLSRVANKAPHLLKPSQAEKAIEYATLLLDMSTEVRAQSFGFSPIVITSLIQIASSFVQAGVNRARKKQRHRTGMDVDNDRDLDVYSSFDRRDLGVTVFANTIVNEKLCPTLLRTFRAVDAAEGVDADIDSFDKFSAKARIAELLLRLWSHPSGNCRESVASLPPSEICAFVSSVSTAAIVCLDFGTEGIEKMYMNRNEQTVMHAAGNLLGMRNYLALLCALSRDERIAAYLGGCVAESPDCKLVAVNLSNMIVQYLEKLTSVDGGTNQYLEEWDAGEPTSCIVSRLPDLSPPDKESMAKEVVGRRLRMRYDLGLDVSIICHQLFALAAKWHIVAARAGDRDLRDSHFLMALAKNEDVDLIHMENVIKRLVAVPEHIEGSEADNADAIFKHDGYVDHSTWIHEYVDKELEKKQKRIWHLVTQDQMKHSEITGVASNEEIMLFLSDLRRKIESTKASVASSPAAVAEAEEAILSKIGSKCEEDYGKYINSEWIVSSSPFSVNEQGEVFLHNYDKLARKRVMQASAKTLMKEARKIRKTMPLPSANSAIYVCFAEERMDLCRVIVSGPVDTPYAHGLFEFDVYFPPTYPQVPPLVTFMTTGGGRVRFNPNLYVDGKVCISLLGVTTASDESQRWNPELSSLAQLMISIQSQILGVKEPYFNEGNGVPLRMKDTDIGRKGSAKYNNTVRLETLRCAMVNHLNCPPKGFEDISVRHFALCRKRIVVQARRWMLEARGTSLYGRYERAYGELVVLLGAQNTKFECLEPLAEDINALESLEPAFIRIIADRIETIPEDGADEVLGAQDSTVLNPWAASPEQVRAWVKSTKEKGNDSDSSSCDELYE